MSVITDIAGAFGAEKAEDAQYAASQAAMAAQRQALADAKAQYQPYAQMGTDTTSMLSRLYGLGGQPADMSAFTASPGYQFRLQQGQDAIESSAAARGGLFSGAAGKALSNYGQQSASQEFDNYVNRLFGMQQAGQNASTGIANAGLGVGNQLSALNLGIGQNQGDAIKSQFNAWGSLGDQAAAAIMGGFTGGAGGAGGAMAGGSGAANGGGGFDWMNAGKMFLGG